MVEYTLTETAKENLEYECEECGETEYPTVINAEESEAVLVDYIVTVECINCSRESKAKVWERDVEIVEE